MDAQISRRTGQPSDILIWGGTAVAFLSLLAMGLQAVYYLLAAFPEGGSVGPSAGWLTGIGTGTALGLVGLAIRSGEPGPAEVAERPSDAARAA